MSNRSLLHSWVDALVNGERLHLTSSDVIVVSPFADDTGSLYIGDSTRQMDFRIYTSATKYMEFNAGTGDITFSGNPTVDFSGASVAGVVLSDLDLGDNSTIDFGDDDDVSIGWNGTVFEVLPVADDTGSLNIGDGTTDFDVNVFLGAATDLVTFDVGAGKVIFDNAELRLGDADELEFGDAADVTVAWSGTALNILPAADDTGAINIGNGTADIDVKIFLGAATDYVEFNIGDGQVNIENAELHFGDNDTIEFGDAADVTAAWSGTAFNILPAADDTGAINIGNGTADIDLKVFLGAATDYAEFNVGDGQVNIEGAELHFGDGDKIEFGDGDDITAAWDGTDLDVLAAADDSVIKFGNGTNSVDVWIYGNIPTSYLEWDASASQLKSNGPVRLDFTSLPLRYTLTWVAGAQGKPGIAADATSATDATREAACKEVEVQGLNATSATTAMRVGGGVTLTTTTGANDQVILAGHTGTSISQWGTVQWSTSQSVEWETDIITGADVATSTVIWAGLKLTSTSATATDDDQVFFRFEDAVNDGEWQAIDSIGGVDTATDTNVAGSNSTRYHLKIAIDANRVARFYINGALVKTSGALTAGVNLKPFVGVETTTTAARAIGVYGQAISRLPS